MRANDEREKLMMWPQQKTSKTKGLSAQWLDLGMAHPLTLGMAHPLKDRLETLATQKVGRAKSRIATTGLVLGITLLSAPLTIAEAGPENQLEDTVVKATQKSVEKHTMRVSHDGKPSKSVIKIHRTNDDGLHRFEIKIMGDKFEAYKLCEDGKKERIPLEDIKGFDAAKAKDSKSWSFDVDDDNNLVFNANAKSHKHAKMHKHSKWKEDGKHKVHVMKHYDKSKHKGHDMDIHMDHDVEVKVIKNLEELEGMEEFADLKVLKKLESLEALGELEKLKVLEEMGFADEGDVRQFVFKMDDHSFHEGDFPLPPDTPHSPEVRVFKKGDMKDIIIDGDVRKFTSKDGNHFVIKNGKKMKFRHYGPSEGETQLVVAQSMLDSADKMLQNIEGEEKALRDAKRDLERARKSLEKATKKMMEAKKSAAKEAKKEAEKKAKGKYPTAN